MEKISAENRIHEMDKFRDPDNLYRMRRLMERLGNPQNELRFIHVAGTNGKGSVSRYIYEILEAAGCRAGIFTSPYIEKFNERIEACRKLISDEDLERLTDLVMTEAEKLGLELEAEGSLEKDASPVTEFDIITATAFLYFREVKADPVVLEVGLGGRGDSTNIIADPLVSVITSIGLDHCDRLGDTIEKIAFEKAGIIKRGRPVISAVIDEKAKVVIMDRAAELGAPFEDVSGREVRIEEKSIEGTKFFISGRGICRVKMAGDHQVRNAVTAVAAVDVVNRETDFKIGADAIIKGLASAVQPGRMEIAGKGTSVIVLDGAHNPEGAEALRKACSSLFSGKRILTVAAVMKDKDIEGILEAFAGFTDKFIFTATGDLRSEKPEVLASKAAALGAESTTADAPPGAVNKALEAEAFDVIIFAGSLYLIGEVRRILREKGFLEEE